MLFDNANHAKQSRLCCLALLTWFSTATATTPYLQHRVRRPERQLDYLHTVERRNRGSFSKFRKPSRSTSSYDRTRKLRRSREIPLQVENLSHDQDNYWAVHVQGANVEDTRERSSGRSYGFHDAVRRLFDQFIGEDLDMESNVTSANLITEVSNATLNETVIFTTGAALESNSSEVNATQNETETFQPIRIRAILAEVSGNGGLLNDTQRDELFVDILSPALLAWSNALRVDPVVGNLTVDVTQLLDGETCGPGKDSGLPSIRVPVTHLIDGIPDTDMIVYLSIGLSIPQTNMTNGTEVVDQISNANDTGLVTSVLRNETQEFLRNASTNGICDGAFLAAASFCSTDQYDRPTAALLHICIDETFFDPSRRYQNILTLMHELGHALGFNSLSMAHFRRGDGTPYTARVDGDVPDKEIECTGPQEERRRAKVALPSQEILRFREVRGGVRVAELVTPSIVQVVRNQFGCQSLTGAELESGEGLPLRTTEEGFACIGDHWERRLFSGDLMNPVVDDMDYSPRISTLTLAYFADSGWYQIDLSGSRLASGWGRGAGCGFVNDACIGENGQVPPQNAPFFCNEISESLSTASEVDGCTPDLSRKATCSMAHHELDLPWEYRYFQNTYGSDVGGQDPLMDYCPVYLGYENGLCASAETKDYMLANAIERFGERNSRCLLGNIDAYSRNTALCLPIACVIEDKTLRIKVDETWYVCEEADRQVGDKGITVICPDPRRICPTFYCPYDCLGTGGQCDYISGECVCERTDVVLPGRPPILGVCGEDTKKNRGNSGNGAIVTMADPEDDDQRAPYPDSPFSDYYVASERELLQSSGPTLEAWMIFTIAGVGAAILSIVFLWRYLQKPADSEWSHEWFRRPNDEQPSEPFGDTINRNKDKMIATVLVDMRIRSNTGGAQSVADTDEQLTDSEATGGTPSESMSEFSGRRSESVSDVDTSIEDIPDDEQQEEAMVIRRRRLSSEYNHF